VRKTRHFRLKSQSPRDIPPEERLREALLQSGLTADAVTRIMDWHELETDALTELRGRVTRLEKCLLAITKSMHELAELLGDLLRGARFLEE